MPSRRRCAHAGGAHRGRFPLPPTARNRPLPGGPDAGPVGAGQAAPARIRGQAFFWTTDVGSRKYDSAGISTSAPIMFHTNMNVSRMPMSA